MFRAVKTSIRHSISFLVMCFMVVITMPPLSTQGTQSREGPLSPHVIELAPTADVTWIDDYPLGPTGELDTMNWGGAGWLILGRANWWSRIYRTGLRFNLASLEGKDIADVALKLFFYDIGDSQHSSP